MALKDILVHVDNCKACPARAQLAFDIARQHDAHVTGLYVMVRPQVPQFIQAHIGSDVLEAQRQAIRTIAHDKEVAFRELAEKSGVRYEWRSVEGDPFEVLNMHTRYTDLVILGQYNSDDDMVPGSSELPDRIVLGAGRPVLVIPYAGDFTGMGRHIMVAWDSSRLAARAVNDALPFMQKAKKVEVLAVNPRGGDGERSHGQLAGADISLHLARHGVNAEAQHIYADNIDPGNMLLSRAADEGIDMIVMGAYGHRRLRELVLGGVTRHMLKHMTVPVLMSH